MQLAVPRLSAIDAPCRMNNSRVLQGQATSVPWQRVPFHQSSVCWFQPTHFKHTVKCQAGLFMTMMMENRMCLKISSSCAKGRGTTWLAVCWCCCLFANLGSVKCQIWWLILISQSTAAIVGSIPHVQSHRGVVIKKYHSIHYLYPHFNPDYMHAYIAHMIYI